MKTTRPDQSEQPELELTDNDLEQVSGGFNPQPDPPQQARLYKVSGELLPAVKNLSPGVQNAVHKI